MQEYYIWDISDLSKSNAALNALNANIRVPITGKNRKTGQLQPGKQKLTAWATEVDQFTNGTCGFERIPSKFLDAINAEQAERTQWMNAFSPTIVPYDPTWERVEA